MLNDMGVDPNDWFDDVPHPHDTMPIATNESLPNVKPTFGGCYNYEKLKAEGMIQDPPAEFMEVPTSVTNPKPEKPKPKNPTIHDELYAIATARYNPFSVGGSENCDSDLDCNIGGSENASSK